jgi:hypothetical protein
MNSATIFQIAATAFGTISGATLFYASIVIPYDKVTYKHVTPAEIAHRRRQSILKWIGLPCLFLAAVLQIISVWLLSI